MTVPSWTELETLFHEAQARPAAERAAWLAERCGGRSDLRAQIEAMLRAHDEARGALDGSAMTTHAPLEPGTRRGVYEIAGRLGAGGMGEVYRARDTTLRRDVAIKILPSAFVADADRAARFAREARVLAALNHPHIAAIYGFEQDALILELVEGETLADRIARGPVPITEALGIARQIAEALEAAHEKGIVHRDLKPANIKITPEGTVKLLDFGLAKTVVGAAGGTGDTVAISGTREGLILGTAAYMSPEQARGQAVDKRTDIWAFGCVLYEMLTGRAPFAGDTISDTLAAILEREPDETMLPADTPVPIRRLLRRCLEKDRKRRLDSASDTRLEIDDAIAFPTAETLARAATSSRRIPQVAIVDLTRQSADAAAPAATRVTRTWKWAAAIGTVLTAAAVVTWWAIAGGLPTRPTAGAGAPQIRTIAVLPLRNISSDPDQQYFADGMTEVLTTSLAQISALNVIAHASTLRYQGTQKTIREIAQELHVDGVVEGAAQRSGDRILITVQLIEASTDRHLWAKSYERDLRDTLALQSEVAQAIAAEIQVQLTPQERARLTKFQAIDPAAQQADLRGHYWAQRGDFQKALAYFQQAVAIDPNYAEAYAYIGLDYGILTYQGLMSAQESYPKWRAAVTRALELDETLAEAHESFGFLLLFHDWNWQESEREFRRAIQLNPSLAPVHLWYSYLLLYTGRTTQAVEEARRAQQLNPFNVGAHRILGYQLVFAQRSDEAVESGRKLLELEGGAAGGHWVLGLAYEQQGKLAQAISEFQEAVKLGGPYLPTAAADLAHAYAISGKTKEALEIKAELTAKSKQQLVPSWGFALIETGLGNKDRAFEWLNKGYNERPSDTMSVKVDPRMNPLRSDPRYQDLLRRMGLPQ